MYTNSRRTTKSTVPKSAGNIEISITKVPHLHYAITTEQTQLWLAVCSKSYEGFNLKWIVLTHVLWIIFLLFSYFTFPPSIYAVSHLAYRCYLAFNAMQCLFFSSHVFNVISSYKAGKRHHFTNYRAVCLLSQFSKKLQKHFAKRVDGFMKQIYIFGITERRYISNHLLIWISNM